MATPKAEPAVSDTWLATYRPAIYTPAFRIGKVLDVCADMDIEVLDITDTDKPRGYVLVLTDVSGVVRRNDLRNRLRFFSQRYLQRWSNLLFHPSLLEVPANVIRLDVKFDLLPERAEIRHDMRPGDELFFWSNSSYAPKWTLIGTVLTPQDEDGRVWMQYASGVRMVYAFEAKYSYAVRHNPAQVRWQDCACLAALPTQAEHAARREAYNQQLDAVLDKAGKLLNASIDETNQRMAEKRFNEIVEANEGVAA